MFPVVARRGPACQLWGGFAPRDGGVYGCSLSREVGVRMTGPEQIRLSGLWGLCCIAALALAGCAGGAGGGAGADGGAGGDSAGPGYGVGDGGTGLVVDIVGSGGVDSAVTDGGMIVDAGATDSVWGDAGLDAEDSLADGGTAAGPDGATDGGEGDAKTDGGLDGAEADGGPFDAGAGLDGELDGGSDDGPDGGLDGGPDGDPDGDLDGGADGSLDGGADGGADPGGDADVGDEADAGDAGPDATPGPELCTNGIDDDQDGKTDCADPDCTKQPGCFEICGNGKDDDVDGKTDCADSDCAGKPGCVELCTDGSDNDADGKVDCADPDCAGKPGCVEVCADGQDNDADGKVDCDDPDCVVDAACAPGVSCDDMYTCLGEAGCGCAVGTSCPADLGPCIQACFASSTCYSGCLDALPADTKASWNAWQSCLVEHCASLPDEEFAACYQGDCLQEYASCFYVGTKSCGAVYSECLDGCASGDQPCVDACFAQLSPEGAVDSILWNDCRFGLCDPADDGTADSLECLAVASWFACADVAGTCNGPLVNSKGCATTTQCVTACGGFGTAKQQCMFGCLGGMSEDATPAVSDLWSCAITSCGTTAAEFTPACASSSFLGPCAAQAAGCGL